MDYDIDGQGTCITIPNFGTDKMLTFDSFTLIPTYSDIESRQEVNVSTEICGIESDLPIINANMLAICSQDMINVLHNNNTVSSYHRFFDSKDNRIKTLSQLKPYKDKIFISIGTKKEEYDFAIMLTEMGFNNILVDVNHGHHKMVGDIIKFIKDNNHKTKIMAGNVSSIDGILFLEDYGADIIKVGNAFGYVCSTLKSTSFGCHPFHVAKKFRDVYPNKTTYLCLDGGIRDVGDIAKSLIYGDIVMLGKMFAGAEESFEKTMLMENGSKMKHYYGNASLKAKIVVDEENHVRNIEGTTKLVPCTGPLQNTLKSIKEGLQSAFSFVNARNIEEFQERAKEQLLMI